ncbi:hypothetical protein CHUAL_013523 [Chamberlinius hualienensis]
MKKSWRESGIAPDGYTVAPPDGKWGWMVLVGCLICGYVGVTIGVSFGVVMNDLIDEFQTTRTTISWVSAILSGVSGILGPLATVMVNMMSCRRTVLIGGLCCSCGLILSSFANGIGVLIVTLGIITGIGNCLVFIALQVVLSCYFRKYYGIAMGILFSGYATSKVTTTPLVQLLLDEFGWRGTLLIIGGFLLNICVGGALFQPSKWHTILVPIPNKESNNETKIDTQIKEKITCIDQKNNMNEQTANVEDINKAEFKIELEKQLSRRLLPNTATGDNNENEIQKARLSFCGSSFELNAPLSSEVLKASIDKCKQEDTKLKTNRKNTETFRQKLANSVDVSLMKERQFYFLAVHYSLLLASMIYSTLYMYSFGVGAGLQPMEAAGLVSARSIGEIIGRTVGPIILAALKLPTIPTFMVAITISGIMFIVKSYMNTVITLYAIGATSGTIFGAAVSLNSVMFLEIVGPKRLSSLIGICTFFQGFVVLGVGPLIGWICDNTGTYASCFILLGVFQFLITLTWIIKLFTDKYFPVQK